MVGGNVHVTGRDVDDERMGRSGVFGDGMSLTCGRGGNFAAEALGEHLAD